MSAMSTDDLAMFGVMGPTRAVGCCPTSPTTDLSNEAIPVRDR